MKYKPRHSSNIARFLDLLSFIFTYPWVTLTSLTVANYLILKPDQRLLKIKLFHYLILGPILASFCISLLPFAIFGFTLSIFICLGFDSDDFSSITFDHPDKTEEQGCYSFASMNVVMGQEVLGKFNNCSFVYKRLKKISKVILTQEEKPLSNVDDLQNVSKSKAILTNFPKMDFICLQEVTDRVFALALVSMIKEHYPHFIFDVGVNAFSTNMFLANSGLMIASKYPIVKVKFQPFSKKKGWQKAVSYGVVICKLDLGNNNVGILANLHTMAYQGIDPLIDFALTEVKECMDIFRRTEVAANENIQFDVICGDFNSDNMSPGDISVAGNDLFKQYTDPAMVRPGQDHQWAVGTEMRQLKLNTPEMQDRDIFRDILIDDVRRRHYILDADVVEQTFDLMVCDPKTDENGEVSYQKYGGMRRIDKILYRTGSASVEGVGYVSALAGLTDHVPVVTTLSPSHHN